MTDKEEAIESGDNHDTVPSAKKSGRASLLDSGEDFEMLDEEEIDDDPPPLEDAGGGNKTITQDSGKTEADKDTDTSAPVEEEWLDVLGLWARA